MVDAGKNEFFFMVSAEEVDVEMLFLFDQKVDDLLGVGAAVDVVAYKNEVVFRLRVERLPQGEKRFETAVNVTNGKCSHKRNLLAQRERL